MSIIITPELVKKYLSYDSEYMPAVGECNSCPFLNYCGAGEYCWKEVPTEVVYNDREDGVYKVGGEPRVNESSDDSRMTTIKSVSPRHDYQRAYYLKKKEREREEKNRAQ